MRIAAWFVAVSLSLAFCGCETVKGVGRDIEGASSSVEKAFTSRNR